MDTGPLSPADFGVPYVYLLPLGYGGYIGGVQGYPITTRPDQTWDWSEHFSWVKGNHTIKLGGNFQRAYTNSLRNNARTGLLLGYFTYYASMSADPIQDSIEELLLGKADNANRTFGDTHRHLVQNSVGFYAQDDWKIKPRLTLTFGLALRHFRQPARPRTTSQPISFRARAWCRSGKESTASTTSTTRTSDLASALPGTSSAPARRLCAAATRWPTTSRISPPSLLLILWRERAPAHLPSPTSGCSRFRFQAMWAWEAVQARARTRPTTSPAAAASIPSTGVGDYICFSPGTGLRPQPHRRASLRRLLGGAEFQDTAGAQLQPEHSAGGRAQQRSDHRLLRPARTEPRHQPRPECQPAGQRRR